MTVTPLDTSSSGQRASTIIIISRITIPDIFLRNVHIKPQVDQELEAGWGKAIVIMPVGNYVWGITKDGSAYTIKDGDKEISWSIHSATQGAEVVPVQDATGEKQRWVFHKVDTPLPC
ncbi:unnamed protein product [Rhizoctonia solani]|uniref:CCL2-like lectin domain-containing protein n=1 Tax=Rhizoctonia solani TaxID=456999 RepID=A0A8H2WSB9_9AGAM|nr:unnamed protein product [Rhizoctonia solani]CAE6414025.1 unnamed protein product [Rhizoctonia solani]